MEQILVVALTAVLPTIAIATVGTRTASVLVETPQTGAEGEGGRALPPPRPDRDEPRPNEGAPPSPWPHHDPEAQETGDSNLTDGMGGDEALDASVEMRCERGPVRHAEALRGALEGRDHVRASDLEALVGDASADRALREAARFFLDNPALLHVLERGGEGGDDNDRIGHADLETAIAALQSIDWEAFRRGIESELTAAEAQALIARFRVVADVAAGKGSINDHVSRDDYEALLTENACLGGGAAAAILYTVTNLPEEEPPCSGWGCGFRTIAGWVDDRLSDAHNVRNTIQDLQENGLGLVQGWADQGMTWVDEQLADRWIGSIPNPFLPGRNLRQSARLAHGAVNGTFAMAEGLVKMGNFLVDLQFGDPDAHAALARFGQAVAGDPSLLVDIGGEMLAALWNDVRACATGDDYACGTLVPDIALTVATGGVGKAASLPTRLAALPARLRALFTRGGARALAESGTALVDDLARRGGAAIDDVVTRDALLATDEVGALTGGARHAPGFTPDGTPRPLDPPDYQPTRHAPGFTPDGTPHPLSDPDFVSPNRHAPGFTADGTPRPLFDPDVVSPNRHAPGFTADGTPRPVSDPDYASPNRHETRPLALDETLPSHAPGFTADGRPRPYVDPDYVSPNRHAPGFTADGRPRPLDDPSDHIVAQTQIVNPVGRTGPEGRSLNCGNCAIATDATLAGRPASALPSETAIGLEVLEAHFGRQFGPVYTDVRLLTSEMRAAGDGARGVVFGDRGADPGHFFNVVNVDGKVVYVDGQSGALAELGYRSWRLLRTN